MTLNKNKNSDRIQGVMGGSHFERKLPETFHPHFDSSPAPKKSSGGRPANRIRGGWGGGFPYPVYYSSPYPVIDSVYLYDTQPQIFIAQPAASVPSEDQQSQQSAPPSAQTQTSAQKVTSDSGANWTSVILGGAVVLGIGYFLFGDQIKKKFSK